VFTALFNIMGVYPAVYAALLVPAARSGNKVPAIIVLSSACHIAVAENLNSQRCHAVQIPAWPFITASFATGIFALLPYFAIWDAPKKPLELPPNKSELVRWCCYFRVYASHCFQGRGTMPLSHGRPAVNALSHFETVGVCCQRSARAVCRRLNELSRPCRAGWRASWSHLSLRVFCWPAP